MYVYPGLWADFHWIWNRYRPLSLRMEAVTTVQENAADVLASAKDINEERAVQEAVVEDSACECEAEPEAEE